MVEQTADQPTTLLSETIRSAFAAADGRTVADLLNDIRDKGFGLLFVILSIPIAAPFTPPGLSTPFGILIIGLAIQLYMKKDAAWVPSWIGRRPLSASPDSKFVRFMVAFTRFFERFTSPRWPRMLTRRMLFLYTGPVVLFSGLVMLLPLPGTNSLPSIGVFLIGMGLIESDGKFVFTGSMVSILGSCLALALMAAAFYYGFDAVAEFIRGLKPGSTNE